MSNCYCLLFGIEYENNYIVPCPIRYDLVLTRDQNNAFIGTTIHKVSLDPIGYACERCKSQDLCLSPIVMEYGYEETYH